MCAFFRPCFSLFFLIKQYHHLLLSGPNDIMMQLNNDSVNSLDSLSKNLPPVPATSTAEPISFVGSDSFDGSLLQAKTLKRKNFKKLSLRSNEPGPPLSNESRSAPAAPKSGGQPTKIRPAPLIGVDIGSRANKSTILDQYNKPPVDSSKTNKPSVIDQFGDTSQTNKITVIDQYNDPSKTNKSAIIDQFNDLRLSTPPPNPQIIHRKRQTVISSISPTKSSDSSPKDPRSSGVNDRFSPISTTSSFKLINEDIITLKNLGSGNSGTVSKILHVPTQKIMAKKLIHIDSKTIVQTQIIRELRILHECHSPYIIDFYGAFINNNNSIVICMEYCNCGSLDKILQLCSPKQFPLFVLKKLTYSILSGLTYLYTNYKIIHRDIKPSNVLMTHKGEFKLCDFGVSRELTNSLAMADTFVGTSTYMSPERIQGLNYGVKSDIWSIGLMLIELASGKSIWTDDDNNNDDLPSGPKGILDLLQRIVNETPPTLSNKINPITGQKYDAKLCQLIDACLVKDDSSRKSPWDLLNDKEGFLEGVEAGVFDKDVKLWAKKCRKLHKERYDNSTTSLPTSKEGN